MRTASRELDARRGTIYDRNGTPLAISQPRYHVQIALNEVRDTLRLVRRVANDLRLPADSLRRSFRRGTPRYLWLQGPWTASEIQAIRTLAGVHLETVYSRAYPSTRLAAPIIGALAPEGGHGLSGLERSLDSLLSGQPGLTTDLRAASGQRYPLPGAGGAGAGAGRGPRRGAHPRRRAAGDRGAIARRLAPCLQGPGRRRGLPRSALRRAPGARLALRRRRRG